MFFVTEPFTPTLLLMLSLVNWIQVGVKDVINNTITCSSSIRKKKKQTCCLCIRGVNNTL